MKEKTMFAIFKIMTAIVVLSALVAVIIFGIKKSERVECEKWQDWQEQYKLFVPGMSQYEQCERYNIILE